LARSTAALALGNAGVDGGESLGMRGERLRRRVDGRCDSLEVDQQREVGVHERQSYRLGRRRAMTDQLELA
jgi:hypothetical protein